MVVMVGEGIKDYGGGVSSSMMYLIHHKNFCKCHNAPPPSTTIRKSLSGSKNV
jgi:hypothetical protein